MKGAQVLVNLGLSVLLARILQPDGYGIYAFAISIVTLLAIPATLGLPTLVIREVAKYELEKRWGLLRGVLERVTHTVVAMSISVSLLAALSIYAIADESRSAQVLSLYWGLLFLPIAALSQVRAAALHGLRKVVWGQLPETVIRPATLLLFCALVASVDRLTPVSTMVLNVLAAAIAFAVGWVFLVRAVPHEVRAVAPLYATKVWLRSALPFSILASVPVVNSQVATVILMYFADSSEVGIFRVATQGGNLLASISGVAAIVVAPHLARLNVSEDKRALERVAGSMALILTLVFAPVTVALFLYGEDIVSAIFGPAYRTAGLPLAILALGLTLSACAGLGALVLNMTGHEGASAKGFAATTIGNVILTLILVPKYGMLGAAISATIAVAAWNTAMCWQAYLRVGVRVYAFRSRPH
ncbi:MAG: flippase [Nitrospiraceae bacterium]